MAARRPLKSRSAAAPRRAAAWLARRGVRPNAISLASVAFALVAAAALAALSVSDARLLDVGLLVVAAAGIQLRLLCNLLDGLVAVEGGLAGATGELYNDVPDRIADPLVLIAAGYAAGSFGPELGWLAALLALLTAYVRVLGGSLRLEQDFAGPMAKQQRMATLTAACAASALEASVVGFSGVAFLAALAVIALGSAVTCARRLRRIARALEAGA